MLIYDESLESSQPPLSGHQPALPRVWPLRDFTVNAKKSRFSLEFLLREHNQKATHFFQSETVNTNTNAKNRIFNEQNSLTTHPLYTHTLHAFSARTHQNSLVARVKLESRVKFESRARFELGSKLFFLFFLFLLFQTKKKKNEQLVPYAP